MIDTVRLYTQEYSLSPRHSLKIPALIDSAGEVKEIGGPKAILGNGWGCHLEKFNNRELLFFDGSVPRLLYGSSLHECGEADCARAQEAIRGQLEQAGVSLSVGAFEKAVTVSRADFCRNLPVRHAVAQYTAALGKYRLPRTDLTQWNSETLLWSNSRREFTFYDKCADLLAKEKDPRVLREVRRVRENLLRVEYRALRGPVVGELVGSRRVRFGELFNRSLSQRILVRTMDRLVKKDSGEKVVGHAYLSQVIEQAKRKRRYSFPLVVGQQGAHSIMSLFGYDYGKVLAFLLQHYPRRSAYRYRGLLEEMCADFVSQGEADLVEEVREKLAA